MEQKPVFFDPEGRRRVWARRFTIVIGACFAVLVSMFVLSLMAMPTLTGAKKTKPKGGAYSFAASDPIIDAGRGGKAWRDLMREVVISHRKHKPTPNAPERIVAGFFAPWQVTGLESFRKNADKMTTVVPAWLQLKSDGKSLGTQDFDLDSMPRNRDLIRIAREHGVRIIPLISNFQLDKTHPEWVNKLFGSPENMASLAKSIREFLVTNKFQGINLDFEGLDYQDRKRYSKFVEIVVNELRPLKLSVSVDIEADRSGLDVVRIAEICDWVCLMAYDQHDDSSEPGPIASSDWSDMLLDDLLKFVPEEKVVLGIGNYAYDWKVGKEGAESLTYYEALSTAHGYRNEPPKTVIRFDQDSGNSTYSYYDDNDQKHKVWLLDACSALNQWRSVQETGIRGAALWALGDEDPTIWNYFDRVKIHSTSKASDLEEINFPYDITFTGKGEIVSVKTRPQVGHRVVSISDKSGTVEDAYYKTFPLPYVLQKTGFVPKKLVLTFDDGPSSEYTPGVLDELKELGVKATFFFMGAAAEENPGLVKRAYEEGHDIGSHSFFHPNLGAVSDLRARLEFDATQRAIESILGHSTVLFRPPYNADSEPQTAEEIRPIELADKLGYITVCENVDPQDWNLFVELPNGGKRKKTAKDIENSIFSEIHRRDGTEGEGNVILLHDAGGDRSATIEALKTIVPELKKQGYQFVTVSELLGVPRDRFMPEISAKERLTIWADRVAFTIVFGGSSLLAKLFIAAIGLGLVRSVLATSLAVIESKKHKPLFSGTPTVSVLIAAYNEEGVIARTIQSVLESDYPLHEIIVVDDGSKDGTSQVVTEQFAGNPKIRLFTKENGGKASALNIAIDNATGEVLLCIDADTQLNPNAIGLLARHFDRAEVAAVAGNVQVGNIDNLLTQWQSIEYTTSQNVDRRAYGMLNAITVVPGAISAWRREAVIEVGKYSSQTLAEDMDLTWRLRRAGYRLENETEAIAYTEAPDKLGAFFKQRFRWTYGTLQCLVKHRKAIFTNGWFGYFALPLLWLFQILFQVLAPLVDIQILISIASYIMAFSSSLETEAAALALHNLQVVAFLYALFFAVELVAGFLAYRLEKKSPVPLIWLFTQRFVYRQIMYGVVFKSLLQAIRGGRTGWGKLERKGTVRLPKR